MPMPNASRPLLAILAFALAFGAQAAPVRTPNVEAELVPIATSAAPGATTTVALRLKMREGWHTYWRNPGDSGLATTIAWLTSVARTMPARIGQGAR